MSIYRCHLEPDVLAFEADVIAVRPGAVLLSQTWLHPGGGGQQADRATITGEFGTASVSGIQVSTEGWWHEVNANVPFGAHVAVRVDAEARSRISQLHTDTHILNALIFQRFNGALVTGAKISADGTAHLDFDLPGADNDLLRSLEPEINAAIKGGLRVRADYVSVDEAVRTPGLIRSLAVTPPPTPDGRYRVIDIEDLDRQACGGTHLHLTSESRPIRITKVINKGRRNRRVNIALT